MTKKNKTVKELNLEFELLEERVKQLEAKDTTENDLETEGKLKGIEEILKTYDDKIKDLDMVLKKSSDRENHDKIEEVKSLVCRVCGEKVRNKSQLKVHIREVHPKTYNCRNCEETFDECWKMEKHLKLHEDARKFNCKVCGKDFHTAWRLKKHTESHTKVEKFCHYFNNGKMCPYDDLGCMFKHEDSDKCKYETYCNFNLCQYKHNENNIIIEEIDEKVESNDDVDSIVDSESESESDNDNDDALTDNDASDFEEVNDLEIEQSQYNDCNGCSKILTTNNSYKCKKCGIVSHRSNCNTWFNTVKKHHFCGGCVYDFKPKE